MSNMDYPTMQYALRFPVQVVPLAAKGLHLTLQTDAKERKQLARNHGLVDVLDFSAEFQLLPWKRRGVRLKGHIHAKVVQSCVVTLEPVTNVIDTPVEVVFLPDDSRLTRQRGGHDPQEIFLDAEGSDAPEVFSGDTIDVGSVAEEFFELAIDPYPRKSDAASLAATVNSGKTDNKEDVEKPVSPFSVLKKLKET